MTTEALAGRKILLMEDEFFVAMEIEDALLSSGALVDGPHSHLENGIAAIDEQRPDAAILDIALADGEVFPIAEKLIAMKVPFLFHTGHGDRERLRDRFGNVVVCRKPTSSDEIAQSVVKLLGAGPATPH